MRNVLYLRDLVHIEVEHAESWQSQQHARLYFLDNVIGQDQCFEVDALKPAVNDRNVVHTEVQMYESLAKI